MKVHETVAKVMETVRFVSKGEKHGQGWSFRGVDAVVNAVAPACRAHGLLILPEVLEHHEQVIPSSGGKHVRSVTVRVAYRLVGPEGDELRVVSVGEAMDHGDKATAKAMSVAWRTALIQTFIMPTDEPDPDHDTYEVAAVPVFDPADSGSWPDVLSQAQAKQVVLVAMGGDREAAAEAWKSDLAGWGSWPAAEVDQWQSEVIA